MYLLYLSGLVFPNPSDCIDFTLPTPKISIFYNIKFINRKSIQNIT